MSNIYTALLAAAVAMLLALALASRFRLIAPAKEDLKPSSHWAEPAVLIEAADERATVLVSVEYEIDPADAGRFLAALYELRTSRRRNGGYGWAVYEDVEKPGRYVEQFLTDSWLEHLRQHQRTTLADKAIQDKVKSFHRGSEPPKVTHLASPRSSWPAQSHVG